MEATTTLTLDFVWASTAIAHAGNAYGFVKVALYVGTDKIRIVVGFPDLDFNDEAHDFDTSEEVDAYLATRFPKAYKAGLWEFGQKTVASHTPEARRSVSDSLFRSLCA